jgi:hypothetical protein
LIHLIDEQQASGNKHDDQKDGWPASLGALLLATLL